MKIYKKSEYTQKVPLENQPFEFNYLRNLQKAPDMGNMFGQDIEPAGKYMTQGNPDNIKDMSHMEHGIAQFENPYIIEWGGNYEEPENWKNVLSQRFEGKTGMELSKAIKEEGYDGIITIMESRDGTKYTSEIVDLRDL